jgi:heavy metal sensor kinase
MQDVGRAYLVAVPLIVALAALGGFFLARRSLAPVAAMGERAAEITVSTLHERLPIATPGDELGRLATIINGLLDRLQQAFQQQRRFMADASHELRTPVAILKTESQVTLAQPNRSAMEYRESAAVMADVANRLARVVDDLFLLARADAGHLTPKPTSIYLDEIVQTAVRSIQTLADARHVHVHLQKLEDAPLIGDADLLGCVLLNLLDNAVKHSPRDGTVDVSLTKKNGSYVVAVSDMGAGVPADARDRIFERFFRVDTARSRSDDGSATGGAGLGLSIARWAAEAHGGRVDLAESGAGKTTFQLTLPATKANGAG